MQRRLGIGMLGTGFMGKMHSYVYATLPYYFSNLPFSCELVGVASGHFANAEAFRDAYGYRYAARSEQELFDDPDIDIIHICTPNALHHDAVIKAARAGKHIYCEKPLAMNEQEARQMVEAVEDAGVITQMVLNNRFTAPMLRAKQLIEEGALGKIVCLRGALFNTLLVDPNVPLEWRQSAALGGGVLQDMGVHILDMIYHLLGPYEAVFCEEQIAYPKRPMPDGKLVEATENEAVYLIVRMKNGAKGTVEASMLPTGLDGETRVEIHGADGALRIGRDISTLEYYDNTLPDAPLGGRKGFTQISCRSKFPAPASGFPPFTSMPGWTRSHVQCLYNFLQNVCAGTPAAPSLRDGLYIQHVLACAKQSARTGRWVTV
nr:Gfo/Idh/MocA family oxidoreductase [Maliibacterium massiliense]